MVYAIVTLGIFFGSAIQRINNTSFQTVAATISILQEQNMQKCDNIECIDGYILISSTQPSGFTEKVAWEQTYN